MKRKRSVIDLTEDDTDDDDASNEVSTSSTQAVVMAHIPRTKRLRPNDLTKLPPTPSTLSSHNSSSYSASTISAQKVVLKQIKEIIDKSTHKDKIFYKVKWDGCHNASQYDSWEPMTKLQQSYYHQSLIDEYEKITSNNSQ